MFTTHLNIYMGEDEDGNRLDYIEGECLSTDQIPTSGIYNGSKVIVMDASVVKNFDYDSKTWLPFT